MMKHAQALEGGDAAHSKNVGSSDEELPDLDYTPVTDRGRELGASTSTESIGIRWAPTQSGAKKIQNSRKC